MSDFVDDVDFLDEPADPAREVRCARCRERGLYWGRYDGRWRLVDEDEVIHKCKTVGEIKFQNLTESE